MKKKYYVCADGGGSKLCALLYDSDFRVIRSAETEGVNTLFKPIEDVKRNVKALIDELLLGLTEEIEYFDACLVGCDGEICEMVKSDPRVKNFALHGEIDMGAAAMFSDRCIIVISGTGSGAAAGIGGEMVARVGGMGSLIGDEGSGYDIGIQTIKAATYATDGRGEPTLLLGMVKEHFGVKDVFEMPFVFRGDRDTRRRIASVARLTARAAELGDKVAMGIYEYAADELVKHVTGVIKQRPIMKDCVVSIIGGAWKGYAGMYARFESELHRLYPGITVKKPIYEPVVGCAVIRGRALGIPENLLRGMIDEGFADYKYKY